MEVTPLVRFRGGSDRELSVFRMSGRRSRDCRSVIRIMDSRRVTFSKVLEVRVPLEFTLNNQNIEKGLVKGTSFKQGKFKTINNQ
jgi:hypothetical protein